MSNEYRHVELLTGDVRRRRWTTEQKLTIIEQSFEPGETVSSAARRHGVAPNLLYRWRRLLSEGGTAAVDSDEPVVGNSEVKSWRTAFASWSACSAARRWRSKSSAKPCPKRTQKNGYRGRSCCRRTVPDEGCRRHARRFPFQSDRAPERQIEAAWLLSQGRGCRASAHHPQAGGPRPTYGYRRIAALLDRERQAADKPVVNAKRVHRIIHDGKVMVMRSNLRWCSDCLEFTCWNGEVIRLALIIDAFDREIIAWTAVANAGISGSDVRDMMLEAVEKRFAATRAPHAIEHLSDNGSAYTARETRLFAQALNLTPCFTPVASPQSNGMSEAFVKTLKRDYIRIVALPDAETALRLIDGWIEDYNEIHSHSALKMASPRQFIRAKSN